MNPEFKKRLDHTKNVLEACLRGEVVCVKEIRKAQRFLNDVGTVALREAFAEYHKMRDEEDAEGGSLIMNVNETKAFMSLFDEPAEPLELKYLTEENALDPSLTVQLKLKKKSESECRKKYRITFVLVWEGEAKDKNQAISYFQQTYS